MGAEVSNLLRGESWGESGDSFEEPGIHTSESNGDEGTASRMAPTLMKDDSMFEFCKRWDLRTLIDFLRFYVYCNEEHQNPKDLPSNMTFEEALPAIIEIEEKKAHLSSLIATIQSEVRDLEAASTAQGEEKAVLILKDRESQITRQKLVCEEKLARFSHIVSPVITGVDLSIEVKWKIFNSTIEAIEKKYGLQSSDSPSGTSMIHLSDTNSSTRHPACSSYVMNPIDITERRLHQDMHDSLASSNLYVMDDHTDESADTSDSDSSGRSESHKMSDPGNHVAEVCGPIVEYQVERRPDEAFNVKSSFSEHSSPKQYNELHNSVCGDRLADAQSPSMVFALPYFHPGHTLKGVSPIYNAEVHNPIFFGFALDKVTTKQAFEIPVRENLEYEHEKGCVQLKVQQLDAKLEAFIASEDAKLRSLTLKEQEYHEKRDKFWNKRIKDLEQARAELNSEDLTLQSRQNQQSHIQKSYDHEDQEIQQKKKFLVENMQNARSQRNLEVSKLRNMLKSEEPLGASRMEYHELEIRRYQGEVQTAKDSLQKAQEDYSSFRSYNNHTLALSGTKQDRHQRGQLLYIEGQIRHCEKELESLCTLFENELYLLERSKSIYQRESRLEPLYTSLQGSTPAVGISGRAPLLSDLAVAFLIGLKNPSLTTRIEFLFNMYAPGSSYMSSKAFLKDRPPNWNGQICALTCKSFTCVLQKAVKILMQIFPTDPNQSLIQEKIQGIAQREFLLLVRLKECNSTFLSIHRSMQGHQPRLATSKKLADSHYLTRLEFIDFCMYSVKQSPQLSRFFNILCSHEHLGRYVMQKISVAHRYRLGLVPAENLKHESIRKQLQYREELSPWNKMQLHKIALAMGEYDTLKTNYRVYLPTRRMFLLSEVVPLHHGGYRNALHHRHECMQFASIKIQSCWRGKQGRRKAVLLAQKQAFYHAKAIELQSTRGEIVLEWKDRESQPDVDSTPLRLAFSTKKFSKLMMTSMSMEKALRKAQDDIEDRFREMEEELGYTDHAVRPEMQVHDLDYLEQEISTFLVHKLSNAKREEAKASQPGDTGENERYDLEDTLDQKRDGETNINQQQLRSAGLVVNEGTKEKSLNENGWNNVSNISDEDLQSSDASMHLVYSYLRRRCDGMTTYNFKELSLELPSKRHICTYVWSFRRLDGKYEQRGLEMDLADHFRIKKNTSDLVMALIELAENDPCFGLTYALLETFQCENEPSYSMPHYRRCAPLSQDTAAFLNSAVGIRNSSSAHDLLAPCSSAHGKQRNHLMETHKALATKAYEKMVHATLEWKKIEQSLLEAGNEEYYLHHLGMGTDRMDWSVQLHRALQLPEVSADEIHDKYGQIYNICHNFLQTATAIAMIIAQEATLPLSSRSIIPLAQSQVDGRKDSTRSTMKRKYEVHSIRFELSLDDHGRFESCDEFAAKFSGHEVRNSALYMRKLGSEPSFLLPLQCCVDTRGFRVLCTSILPIHTNSLTSDNDNAERNASEQNLLQGTKDHGKAIIASSKKLGELLAPMSKELNTSQHFVRGSRDLVQRSIYGPADLQVYSVAPGLYNLLGFGRAMPPEDPGATKHLTPSTRGMSILWRQLRSEFVRKQSRALSPDALFFTSYRTTDWLERAKDIENATFELLNTVIPQFAKEMRKNEDYYLGSGDDNYHRRNTTQGAGKMRSEYELTQNAWNESTLTRGMHRHGINMRHLGLLRAHLKSNDSVNTLCDPSKMKEPNFLNHTNQTMSPTPSDENRCSIGLPRRLSGGNLCDDKRDFVTRPSSLHALALAEMVARTLKNVIRHFLREAAKQTRMGLNSAFLNQVIVKLFNLFTGGRRGSDAFWKFFLIQGVRARFGHIALSRDEELNARTDAVPWFHYIVNRVSNMLGLSLTAGSLLRLQLSPNGHIFSSEDVLAARDCQFGDLRTPQSIAMCRVKSNLCVLHFAMASLLSLQGSMRQTRTYNETILDAQPHGYWPLCDAKGTTEATNLGSLGAELTGKYIRNCELEATGFVCNSEYDRAVRFRRSKKTFVNFDDCHVPLIHMQDKNSIMSSLEAWCACVGLYGRRQTVVAVGCLSLDITMSSNWAVMLQNESSEVVAQGPPVSLHKWTYLTATLTSTTLRLYIDGRLEGEVVWHQISSDKFPVNTASLSASKVRIQEMNENQSSSVREEKDDNVLNGDNFENERKALEKKPRPKVFKLFWPNLYKRDNMDFSVRDEASKAAFGPCKLETLSNSKLAEDQGVSIGVPSPHNIETMHEAGGSIIPEFSQRTRPTRIACLSSERNRDGKHFFQGMIAHVACYLNKCLAHEDINAHYIMGTRDRTRESENLFDSATERFARCLYAFDPYDHSTLRNFAKNVCASPFHDNQDQEFVLKQKRKIRLAVNALALAKCVHGIAEIMRHLPHSPKFSDLFISCYQSIIQEDPSYFRPRSDPSCQYAVEDLAEVPFALFFIPGSTLALPDLLPDDHVLLPDCDMSSAYACSQSIISDREAYHKTMQDEIIQTFADIIIRTVVPLPYFFSQNTLTNLDWLENISSHKVIIYCALRLRSEGDLERLCFEDIPDISSQDLELIARSNTNCKCLSIPKCTLLAEKTIQESVSICRKLEELDLSFCNQLHDSSLVVFGRKCHVLKKLSVAHCHQISDLGLGALLQSLGFRLERLDINHCDQLTDATLTNIGTSCTMLQSLDAQWCFQFTARGLQRINKSASFFSSLEWIDISGCRKIDTEGIIYLADCCTNLQHIKLDFCDRLTSQSISALVQKCTRLKTLHMQELALVTNEIIFGSQVNDDIPQPSIRWELANVSLSGCTNLDDEAFRYLCTHMGKLESLNVSSCSSLTQDGFYHFAADANFKTLELENLDLSFCPQFKAADAQLFTMKCSKLTSLNLSGLVSLDTLNVTSIIETCPHLIKLHLGFCRELSDSTLRFIATKLALQDLNIERCSKMTDDGLLALIDDNFTLQTLNISSCKLITDIVILSLMKSCPRLRQLNIELCSQLTQANIVALRRKRPALCVHYSEYAKPTKEASKFDDIFLYKPQTHIYSTRRNNSGVNYKQ
uniref:Uncharacterized protein AlNc14C165G7867 n=1 Tax=Albugo laibachii Nc14 TaxID=890382 RepID=F0WN35_9STRA|nr:conserved hypothetical protein [Albugo laibachii Nc14]|eukprot:CCA22722.1 conserved hypothetical protein [Albugo laibachii Nc14]